jgi:anaerobic selenocysteine-containing dehydrogenase
MKSLTTSYPSHQSTDLLSFPIGKPGQVVPGQCGVCPAGCGVNIHLENGFISRITPHKAHPQGICCPRGTRAPEVVYAPERLQFPLKRTGPPDTAQFERISWDEALETIAHRLKSIAAEYGPEALCLYTGRGTFEQSLCDLMPPAGVRTSSAWSLFFPLGSPNTTGVGAICYVAHGVIAPVTTCGVWDIDTFADIENAELVVVWGGNPATDSPPTDLVRIKQAVRRGAQVIVIDHRHNETARAVKAEWIGIRPGSDGALALAMLNVIINEGFYDRDFVERWTVGFEALRAYVADFTPEKAEQITFVPADMIRKTARRIAGAAGVALVSYTGLEYTNSGTQNIRAVLTLWALSGNLDVPGGKVFNMPGATFRVNETRRLEPPAGVKPIGADKFPLYHLYRKEAHATELPRAILEGEPYPIKAMMIAGASVITALPNPDLWRRSFAALDFLVVVDRFLTADALYADIVLPATTLFESQSYSVYGSTIQVRPRIIPPLVDSRPDWDIIAALAEKLGYGHLFPASSNDVVRYALDGTDIDPDFLDQSPDGVTQPTAPMQYRKWETGLLRPDGRPGFNTPTGKFEIVSTILADYGYDPLPVYTEPLEGPLSSPNIAADFPLVFNSGARIQSDFRSQHHNIAGLLKLQPHPLVWLHPQDAAARGIHNGDAVFVLTPRGKVPYTAKVTEYIVPGVVEANAGGGSPIASAPWRECNVNELTDHDNRDPISGFPVYKALLCEVVKA